MKTNTAIDAGTFSSRSDDPAFVTLAETVWVLEPSYVWCHQQVSRGIAGLLASRELRKVE